MRHSSRISVNSVPFNIMIVDLNNPMVLIGASMPSRDCNPRADGNSGQSKDFSIRYPPNTE
jgi:hypothetical protein